MTLDEMADKVYALTGRPDKIAATKEAIKAATLKAHKTDFYSSDIVEVLITLGASNAYVWSFDVISYISNFRSLKYIRRYDDVNAKPANFIDIITPEEVLDTYGNTRANVAYRAGRNIEIKSYTAFKQMLFACYVFPIVTDGGYSSWIADQYTYAIVYEAARILFKTIGHDDQASQYEKLVMEEYSSLQTSALTDIAI